MSLGTFPTTFPKYFQKVRLSDMANLTIKDIARISGCSVSTISRVINDRPDVRPETKEHVLKVMREAGFVPNTNARQLKIQQSRSLVFVVKGTRNIFFSDFLVQLQRAATLYGYNASSLTWTRTPTRSTPPKRSCGRSSPKASSSWAAA